MTLRSLLGAASALALGALSLHAQTDVWIASSGVWSNAANWSLGVPANDGSALVGFGSAPNVASVPAFSSTVDANFSINTLTVAAQAGPFQLESINGAVLTIGDALNDQSSHSVTLAVPLSGSMTLENTGTATLTISGTQNAFKSATEIESGIYQDANANAFSAASALEVASGAAVDVNHNETIPALNNFGNNGGGSVVLASGATLTLSSSTTSTFSGVLSGPGSMAFNDLTSTLSGSNTYSGGTTLMRGILIANNPATPGGLSSATGTGTLTIMPGALLELGELSATGSVSAPAITDNGTIVFLRTDASALTGNLSGTGGITQLGSGTMTLSGTNSYSGTTTVEEGTLTAGSTSAFGGTGLSPVVMAAATLNLNGFANRIGTLTGTSSSTINLGSAVLTLGRPEGQSTFPGLIAGTGGLVLDGLGETTALGDANTFSGGVTVDSGTLLVGNNQAAGTGTLTLESGSILGASGASIAVTNPISATGKVQFGADNDNALTLNGPISGAASIDYVGGSTGSLTLGGTNLSLSGPFTVTSGTAIAASNSAFGPAGNTVTLTNGSTLGVNANDTVANPLQFTGPGASTLTGSGTFSFPLAASALVDIAPGRPIGTLTFSGGLTFATGSALTLHVLDASGASGVGYGTLNATDGLSFTANPGTLAFNLVSVNASGASANAGNFSPNSPFSWTFATSSTPILGSNVPNQFSLNTAGFTNATNGGTFSFSEAGNDLSLSLNFTPAPEPSTYVLLAMGLLGLVPWMLVRRARVSRNG